MSNINNGTSPASPATSLQFNNSGVFGGSSSLTWDNTAGLYVDRNVYGYTLSAGNDSGAAFQVDNSGNIIIDGGPTVFGSQIFLDNGRRNSIYEDTPGNVNVSINGTALFIFSPSGGFSSDNGAFTSDGSGNLISTSITSITAQFGDPTKLISTFDNTGQLSLSNGAITTDVTGDLNMSGTLDCGAISAGGGSFNVDTSGNTTVSNLVLNGNFGGNIAMDQDGNAYIIEPAGGTINIVTGGGANTFVFGPSGQFTSDNGNFSTDGIGDVTWTGTFSSDAGTIVSNGSGFLTVADFQNNGSSSLLGALTLNRTAVSNTNHTTTSSDYLIAYTSITAARVVTLSLPFQGGRSFIIKDESGSCSGTNTITITPASGTIDGAASKVLNSAYASVRIYTNGTNFFTE